jgi:hypothetical protein
MLGIEGSNPSRQRLPQTAPFFSMVDQHTQLGEEIRLPMDPGSWSLPKGSRQYDEEHFEAANKVIGMWTLLSHFFVKHGYYLYRWQAYSSTLPPDEIPRSLAPDEAYPFPRRISNLIETDFAFIDIQVRAPVLRPQTMLISCCRGFEYGLRVMSLGERLSSGMLKRLVSCSRLLMLLLPV